LNLLNTDFLQNCFCFSLCEYSAIVGVVASCWNIIHAQCIARTAYCIYSMFVSYKSVLRFGQLFFCFKSLKCSWKTYSHPIVNTSFYLQFSLWILLIVSLWYTVVWVVLFSDFSYSSWKYCISDNVVCLVRCQRE